MANGTVYLLHFAKRINPDRPAQHYLGWSRNLTDRLNEHANGSGSRLCQVAKERGIGFAVARTWEGDRTLERQLKNRKSSPRLCPVCAELNHA